MSTVNVDGGIIKSLREAHDWTQGEMAYHAKVDQSLISKLESGERSDIRVSTLKKLATALGVPVGRLIGEAQTATPTEPDLDLADPELHFVMAALSEATPEDRRKIIRMIRAFIAEDDTRKRGT